MKHLLWPSLLTLNLALAAPLGAALPYFNFTLPWNDAADNAASVAFLNDHVAGSQGFVYVDGGGHFATSAGRLRFWGTNATFGGAFPSASDAPQVAGRLAKAGFNIVRFHHMDFSPAPNGIWLNTAPERQLDPANLGRLDWFIYQLKLRGIYTNLNLVVSRPFNPGTELHPDILLIDDWKVRAVTGFFDPANLALQRQYASDLLNHVNPYTGMAYKNEPAVAFVEINNENGLVQAFKSAQLDNLPPYYKGLLNSQWNAWLQAKYAGQAALNSSWAVLSATAGPEIMANGSFASGLTSWNFERNGSPQAAATATVTAEGPSATASARIVVSSPGQQGWHVQLNQGNRSVTAGQPYTLRFWAKSDAARTIFVDLGMAHSPWGGLGFNNNLNLTAAWAYFEFVFTPSASDTNARINFSNMGLQTGSFWFSQVSLKNEGILGLYDEEDLAAGTIRNFLQSGDNARTAASFKDWYRFLLAKEETYWLAMKNHVQSTLGYQGLVMGTVIGCSTPNLMARMDSVDTHAYWRHPSFPGTPWDPVDWYVNNAAMPNDPGGSLMAGLSMQAVLGKPHSITEINSPHPNTHEADLFPLIAAYGGLQDFDAIYPFDYWGGYDNWAETSLNSFFALKANVLKMSQSPLAALMFRRGDFAPAAQLVAVPMDREDEVEKLGPAWAWTLVNATSQGENSKAGLIHRVRIVPEGAAAPGGSLAPGSTSVSGTLLASDTGQLRWDTGLSGAGVVGGDSPRAKIVAGWGGGRSFAFTDLTISPGSSLQGGYGAIMLASLDGLSISASTRLLISAVGLQRNAGSSWYQYPNTPVSFPPAENINVTLRNQWGSGPPEVEGIPAGIVLPFAPSQVQAWALSPSGARGAALSVGDSSGFASLSLDPGLGTLWYEVEVDHAAYSPTPTRTPTPVLSPTPTLTVSPTPTPFAEWTWDDFETGWTPAAWQAYGGGGASVVSVARITGTANTAQGFYAHQAVLDTGPAGAWSGFMVNSPYGTRPSLGYQSLSGMNYLELWVRSNTTSLRFMPILSETGTLASPVNGADGEQWQSANGAWTTVPAGTWTQVVLPLSAFRDQPGYPYNPTSLGNNALDLQAINFITLAVDGGQGANVLLEVDQVRFFRDLGSPTPSKTPSPTRSPTSSVTPTATLSPTSSQTPTPSESPALSPTPSFSQTLSATETPSLSGTPVASPTVSFTETETAVSFTSTSTYTPTPSLTPSVSPGFAATVSATRTPSAGGRPRIRSHGPVLNPSGGRTTLSLALEGSVEAITLKIYSSAYALALSSRFEGPFGPGRHNLMVDVAGLGNGAYFYSLDAVGAGEKTRSSPGKLYIAK